MFFKNKMKIIVSLAIILIAVGCFANCTFAAPISGFSPKVDSWGLVKATDNTHSSYVQYNGVKFSAPQVAYAMAKSIALIAEGKENTKFSIPDFRGCDNSHGADIPQMLSKSQYVDMADRYSSWTQANGQLPNYVGINQGGVPDISCKKSLTIWKNVLTEYHKTGNLPSTVSTE